MNGPAASLHQVARDSDFSGVIRVDRGGRTVFAEAYGLADRSCGIPNTLDAQFAIASGTKGLTALTVVSLIEDGRLRLDTAARSILDDDLPLIRDDVTIEQLLAHRSGIGDYFDEEAGLEVGEYLLPVPAHELWSTERYVPILDGFETKFPPGERFSYCNGGYVVLALIAERVSRIPFDDLVSERVCVPAAMTSTAFLRSDELPCSAARGYLDESGMRTNVFHLPVLGTGDGGIYSTVGDLHRFWDALFSGRIVPRGRVAEMVSPRSDVPSESMRYGLGFWLHRSGPSVILQGYDSGASFRSSHDPDRAVTYTIVSNTSEGAWPIARHLRDAPTVP